MDKSAVNCFDFDKFNEMNPAAGSYLLHFAQLEPLLKSVHIPWKTK